MNLCVAGFPLMVLQITGEVDGLYLPFLGVHVFPLVSCFPSVLEKGNFSGKVENMAHCFYLWTLIMLCILIEAKFNK